MVYPKPVNQTNPVFSVLLLVQVLPQPRRSKREQYAFANKTSQKHRKLKKILNRFPSFSPVATMPTHPQERQKMLNWANFLVTSYTPDINRTKTSSILIIVRTGLLGVKNLGRTMDWAGKLLGTGNQPHAYGHEV